MNEQLEFNFVPATLSIIDNATVNADSPSMSFRSMREWQIDRQIFAEMNDG